MFSPILATTSGGATITGTGALAAQAAALSGAGSSASSGAGSLQAQSALIIGVGAVSGAAAVVKPGSSGGKVRRGHGMPMSGVVAPPLPKISGMGNLRAGAGKVYGTGLVSGESHQQRRNRRTLTILMAA